MSRNINTLVPGTFTGSLVRSAPVRRGSTALYQKERGLFGSHSYEAFAGTIFVIDGGQKVAKNRFRTWLVFLIVVSFAPPVAVFGADMLGLFPENLESIGWILVCISFAAMVLLTLWAAVEEIKFREKTGEIGIWLGVFFFFGPLGAIFYLWNLDRSTHKR